MIQMPCQCSNPTIAASDADTMQSACECATGASGCECGSGVPAPSDQETSLERVVMELDQRVRKLEAGR